MNKYSIEIVAGGRAEGAVKMSGVECSSNDVACIFAEALASLMPETSYYCQKNSRDIEVEWHGSAELEEVTFK